MNNQDWQEFNLLYANPDLTAVIYIKAGEGDATSARRVAETEFPELANSKYLDWVSLGQYFRGENRVIDGHPK